MNKPKVIALFGKSGAGKDEVLKLLSKNKDKFHKIISSTTRPKRDCETDGVEYNFITNEDFVEDLLINCAEVSIFNNWIYGTFFKDYSNDKINIGVFNISSIEKLLDDNRYDVLPIEIYADDKVRLLRCLNREGEADCHEICRRFEQDTKDFEDIEFDYERVKNNYNWGVSFILDDLNYIINNI